MVGDENLTQSRVPEDAEEGRSSVTSEKKPR